MDHEIIELTFENMKDAIGLDIIAFKWAAGGACGEPGGVVFITKDAKIYHTNYVFEKYGITISNLYTIFPPLKDIDVGIFGGGYYPAGWKDQYLGLGNYLVVQESYWETFSDMAQKELERHHSEGDDVILYNIWADVVLKVLEQNQP